MHQQLKKKHALLMVYIHKKIRVILCLSLISLLALKVYPSNITVSGTISTDSTWSTDTVIIDGDVTVNSSAKLTIDPATVIYFTGYYKLTIYGIISAIGTLGDTIVFTRDDTTDYHDFSTTTGGWAGIELNTTNMADSFLFRFCKIEYIKSMEQYPKGISFLNGKRFDIERSVYKDNLGCIYVDANNAYIDSCSFYNNNKYYFGGNNYTCKEIYVTRDNSNIHILNNTIKSASAQAMRIWIASDVYIKNNSFTKVEKADNTTSLGTFISLESSYTEVINNTFTKEAGTDPTGIMIQSGEAFIDSNNFSLLGTAITITNNAIGTISNNTMDLLSVGINNTTSFFNISGNTISNCSQWGAFLHAFSVDTLENNIFKNNTKAIEVNQSDAEINNTIVCNNTSYGIFLDKSTVNINNCLIANNNSNQYGSAIYALYSTGNIINSTIANNADVSASNAPVTYTSSNGDITNTIFWGNEADSAYYQISITDNDIQPSFYYCNIQGSIDSFVLESGVTYNGTLTECVDIDPEFVNPTFNAGNTFDALETSIDWTLNTSSPCINKGLNSEDNTLIDLNGGQRILNGIIDMGAYETYIPKTTYGGGTISTEVHWLADTVIVNNSFLITNTGSLIIDPGVTVIFSGDYHINCTGLFQANGSEDANIIFTVQETSFRWDGLDFDEDETENDTTRLSFCNFKYLNGQFTIDDRNKFIIKNCLFDSSTAESVNNFIDIDNSVIEFNNNELKNISNYGMIFYINSSFISMKNNNLNNIEITQQAFRLLQTEIDLTNNTFYNITMQYDLVNFNNCKGSIINNLIYNNEAQNLFDGNNVWNDIYIGNNTISRNSSTSSFFYISGCDVDNNIIVNNSNSSLFNFVGYPSTYRNNYLSTGTSISGATCIDCIYDNDPQFFSPTLTNGISIDAETADWHINSFSQAINNGYSDVSNLPSTDYDGNSRVNDEQVDIGAYEHQGGLVDIEKNPVGKIICEGDSVFFYVEVDNTATFQWQKDGNDISGATDDTLIIAEVTESDQGSYTCDVSNGYGTNTSSGANLFVKNKSKILANPESRFITEGSQLSIEVAVTGTEPITYEWYANDTLIPAFTTALLQFAEFDTTNEGNYKLYTSNQCGIDSTNVIGLYVLPTTSIQNNDTLFCEGDAATLFTYTGFDASYQWRKNGINLTGETTAYLNFDSILVNDEGNYTCFIAGDYGNIVTNPIFITVNEAPDIISQPASQLVDSLSSFTITVEANGTKPLQYQWYKDGDPLLLENSNELQFVGFRAIIDEGIYTCAVQNGCDTDTTSEAAFYIKPKVIIQTENGLPILCIGDSLRLSVIVNYSASYQWRRNGVDLSGETSSSIYIDSIETSEAGSYTCYVVGNYSNVETSPVYIFVSEAPNIVSEPVSQWIDSSSSFTVNVGANGTNPIIYQWYKDGIPILLENSNQLKFAGFRPVIDEGVYNCIVQNGCGVDSTSEAAFYLTPKIDILTGDGSPTACIGDSLKLSVTTNHPATFKWRKNGTDI
ncbi:MAG: immunoglobulin domain-containing protein, partial [Bacteroidales bacterium]|nr:immunoglobulin domain-containing protein [Bacteroidales bacterium]